MKVFCGKVILIILLFSLGLRLDGKMLFNSKRLEQIFELLGNEYKKIIQENSKPGSYYMNVRFKGEKCKIIYRINKYKELEHLGVMIINDSSVYDPIREVYDYLEREFLVSAILNEKYPLMGEVEKDKIKVFYNDSLLNGHESNNVYKISVDISTPYRIKQNPNFFEVEWSLRSSNKFRVKIPNVYSLITERTKDELEMNLLRKLKNSQNFNLVTTRPKKNQLKLYDSNVFLLQGDSFAGTPGLTSNSFYVIRDSIDPVFMRKYFRESIANLFLNLIKSPIMLDITENLYGGIKEKFTINVNNFYSNFSKEHVLYFGWLNIDEENLKASIIINNPLFNYNHLLIVSINPQSIFDNSDEVKATFYSYIPIEKLNQSIY